VGKLICIECRQEFDTPEQAWRHVNPLAGKDVGKGVARVQLKRHIIFPKTERPTPMDR